jgi:flagellar protein FlgJ
MDVTQTGLFHYNNIQSNTAELTQKARNQKLREVSQDFEAIFVKKMLDSMRDTIPDSGLMEKSHAEKIYKDMLYKEYAQMISRNSDLGLAEQVYEQLSNFNTDKG